MKSLGFLSNKQILLSLVIGFAVFATGCQSGTQNSGSSMTEVGRDPNMNASADSRTVDEDRKFGQQLALYEAETKRQDTENARKSNDSKDLLNARQTEDSAKARIHESDNQLAAANRAAEAQEYEADSRNSITNKVLEHAPDAIQGLAALNNAQGNIKNAEARLAQENSRQKKADLLEERQLRAAEQANDNQRLQIMATVGEAGREDLLTGYRHSLGSLKQTSQQNFAQAAATRAAISRFNDQLREAEDDSLFSPINLSRAADLTDEQRAVMSAINGRFIGKKMTNAQVKEALVKSDRELLTVLKTQKEVDATASRLEREVYDPKSSKSPQSMSSISKRMDSLSESVGASQAVTAAALDRLGIGDSEESGISSAPVNDAQNFAAEKKSAPPQGKPGAEDANGSQENGPATADVNPAAFNAPAPTVAVFNNPGFSESIFASPEFVGPVKSPTRTFESQLYGNSNQPTALSNISQQDKNELSALFNERVESMRAEDISGNQARNVGFDSYASDAGNEKFLCESGSQGDSSIHAASLASCGLSENVDGAYDLLDDVQSAMSNYLLILDSKAAKELMRVIESKQKAFVTAAQNQPEYSSYYRKAWMSLESVRLATAKRSEDFAKHEKILNDKNSSAESIEAAQKAIVKNVKDALAQKTYDDFLKAGGKDAAAARKNIVSQADSNFSNQMISSKGVTGADIAQIFDQSSQIGNLNINYYGYVPGNANPYAFNPKGFGDRNVNDFLNLNCVGATCI